LNAPPPSSEPRPTTPAPAATSDVPLDKVLALWPRVLDRVQANSRVAHLLVRDCRPVSLSNSILTLSQTNAGAVAAFAQGGHAERVRQAILDELKLDLTVEMTLGDQPAPTRPAAEPVVEDVEDTPSEDDESVEATAETGLELLQRELGGRKIAEFDAE